MTNLVTIPEAAKLFSASHQGIRAWIRDGMPATKEVKKNTGKRGTPRILIDPVAARQWMIEHNVRTFLKSEVAHSDAAKPDAVPVQQPAAQPQAKQVSIAPGVEGALDRLRNMELRAFSDYVKARNAGDVLGQRAHMKLHSEAVKRMLEAEDVSEQRKLIESEERTKMMDALTAWWEPVKALLDQMPRSMASRCNVADPSVAEASLRDWLLSQLYPMANRKP